MKPSQLEDDLAREARNRLTKWGEDTIMRCEIAGLSHGVTVSILLAPLIERVVMCCKLLNLDPVLLIEHGQKQESTK